MKNKYLILIISFLLLSCSNDKSTVESEPEPEPELNLAPNDFDINTANISSSDATIYWTEATDPEEDVVTYNIYLNGNVISENISELTYQFTELNELTNYSGRVVAKDSNNNETSKTFSFITEKYYLKYLKRYDYGQINYGVGYATGSPYSMIKTNDQNYVMAGVSVFPNGNGYRLFTLKIDYEGNVIWKKFYDYQLTDGWSPKIINSSTGFVLVSHHHVLSLDSEGNTIWYKKIDSYDIIDNSADIKSVAQDSEGNIFIVGGRGSDDSNIKQQAVLTKLDISGNVLWEKIYEPSRRNFFDDIIINNEDLIILGSTEINRATSTQDEQIDFWVLKLNNEGGIIWEKTFGDGKYDMPKQIISTSDDSFVFVGYGASLFKIDNAGNLIWSNTELSAFTPTFSISETSDNGFVTIGNFYVDTYIDFLLISKYGSNGNLEWEKSYSEYATWISGKCILSENDGGYRIAGSSSKYNYNSDEKPNLLMFKTDPQGNFE